MTTLIQENFINATEHNCFSTSEPHEPTYNEKADLGKLYRSLRQEYGRCQSRIYLDTKSQGVIAVGWVFVKRCAYEDTGTSYLREVWVTVYETCDENDPLHLTRKTAHGTEHTNFKYCVIGKHR